MAAAEILCLTGLASVALAWRRGGDAPLHLPALAATLAAAAECALALFLQADWWRAGRYAAVFLAIGVLAQVVAAVRAQPPFAAPNG